MNAFRIIGLVLLNLFFCYSCVNKNTKSNVDYYKESFNSTRDSIGLMPFDEKWHTTRFEERNAYWCNDSNIVKLMYDTVSMIGKSLYTGKCLMFNDADSLDNALHKEIDVFVIKNRDNRGRVINNRLSLIYNFKADESHNIAVGWEYSLEEEMHDIEKSFFPQGARIVQVERIAKQEADSILKAWELYHPSMR